VLEVIEPRVNEGDRPMKGGPNDLRLGISSLDQKCQTCGESRDCQGHIGHIKLPQTVFHYGLLRHVINLLKVLCHNCGKLKMIDDLSQKEKFEKILRISSPIKRLDQMSKLLCKVSKCLSEEGIKGLDWKEKGCGGSSPINLVIRNHNILIIESEGDKKRETVITASQVKCIFEKMCPQEVRILGFCRSHPVDLLIDCLVVVPPQIRPSIDMDAEKKAEDDITMTYVKILHLNNEIRKSEGCQREQKVADLERLVGSIMIRMKRAEMEMTSFIGRYKIRGKVIKSFEDRLKSK